MKNKFAIALSTLAMASLLSISALADCSQMEQGCRGSITGLHDGTWMLLIDNATRNNFENMTLAQIDALTQKKMQELDNMALDEIEALKQKKLQERENMPFSELQPKMPMGKADRFQGAVGLGPREDSCRLEGDGFFADMGGYFGLLMDDVSKDKLNNMTLAEIRDMRVQKMQKMQNMTLAEIEALKQKKMQELSNMTLAELKEQGVDWIGMAGPMRHFAGMEHNDRDGRPGPGSRR